MLFIKKLKRYALFAVLFLVAACGAQSSPTPTPTIVPSPTPDPHIYIDIIYAPETERYMKQVIADFNKDYDAGKDPLTGNPLAAGDPPIRVRGKSKPSGQAMDAILAAASGPNIDVGEKSPMDATANASAAGNTIGEKPTIFMPSVSHWLVLANYKAKRDLFDLNNSPTTTNDPVVIAIWQSRLKAIQDANPGKAIGWKELMDVMTNPKGWAAYYGPAYTGRSTIYYGHTDPFISSSGLSTLISEYYACALYTINFTPGSRLTLNEVNNQAVRDCVKTLHKTVRHYAINTIKLKEYLACDKLKYLDFVALPEDEFLQIAQGTAEVGGCQQLADDPLVALYPSEGTFYHEHPFAIVQADWVTLAQRTAAEKFKAYLLSKTVQQNSIGPGGFRPANPNAAVGNPFSTANYVDLKQPSTVFAEPEAAVISAVQQSWSLVKKPSDIWLLVDISNSMKDDGKLVQAQQAALAFVDHVDPQDRVGLIVFNDQTRLVEPLKSMETNKENLKRQINSLEASGDTALYDALQFTITEDDAEHESTSGDRVRAIVLLSDGQETKDANKPEKKEAILDLIRSRAGSDSRSPVLVIPIAYGSKADNQTLEAIAGDSLSTKHDATAKTIGDVLEEIRKEG